MTDSPPPAYRSRSPSPSNRWDDVPNVRAAPDYIANYVTQRTRLIAISLNRAEVRKKSTPILGLFLFALFILLLTVMLIFKIPLMPEGEQRPLGSYWDELKGNEHCFAYGTREYTAHLRNIPLGYDWTKACQRTKIEIRGVIFETPHRCEDLGLWGGMIGHWMGNTSEYECLPFWGKFIDKGCTGPMSGLRRFESRLWNIHIGEDWNKMCSTAPADFFGLHFERPKSCINEGLWGIYGMWELHDSNC